MLDHCDLDSQLSDLLGASHWYVGYSGGLDSAVLLHLLHQWSAAHPSVPPLTALHINHGLQTAADDWQRHCEEQCRALNLPCVSVAVTVPAGGSREEAARDARYSAFSTQMEPRGLLFLGHHLDDQVETFFLRLMRGSGVEGLAAMPRRRSLAQGELVRPLLDYSRGELEEYALQHGLSFVEDPSNQDTAMDRNYLRREVLPALATRWPAYRQAVARASEHLAGAARLLDDIPETLTSVTGDPGISRDFLVLETVERGANRLRAWLRSRGCQAPDYRALMEFLRQLRDSAADTSPRLTCGQYSLQRFGEAVYLLPLFDAPPPTGTFELAPGDRCDIPGVGTLSLGPGEGLRLEEGEVLTLRFREGGEKCRLPGRSGSRSLKSVWQEMEVPPWWRDRVPLVYLQDKLLSIGGLQDCESARWSEQAREGEPRWCIHWKPIGSAVSD